MKHLLPGLLLTASLVGNLWLLASLRAQRGAAQALAARVAAAESEADLRATNARTLQAASDASRLSDREREELLRLRTETGGGRGSDGARVALENEAARLRALLAAPAAPAPIPSVPPAISPVPGAVDRDQLVASIQHDEALLEQWERTPEDGRAAWLESVQGSDGLGTVLSQLGQAVAQHEQAARAAEPDPDEIDRLERLIGALQLQARQEAENVIVTVAARLGRSRLALQQLDAVASSP